MPKSYVPRGSKPPRSRPYVMPSTPTRVFPGGGGGTTQGGSRRPPRSPAGPVFGAAPKKYSTLTMPSRKGSGPFGDTELRAGFRRLEGAEAGASQPGVKAAIEVRKRRVSGEFPPALNRGQHTALIYTAAGEKSKNIKKKREGMAARIRLQEQGY